MKATSVIYIALALVAAALGFWVLAGVAAFLIRVIALVFLVLALLAFRKKVALKG